MTFPLLPKQTEQKWTLKVLTPRHREIADLLLEGELDRDQIAAIYKLNRDYISMLKQQPLFREYIEQRYAELDEKFRSLYHSTISAVQDGLNDADTKNRLSAARLYLESHGKMDGGSKTSETAEDVITRMLNLQINVQANFNQPPTDVHSVNVSNEKE